MTPEILDLLEKRRKAKADEQKCRELNNHIENRCNETKKHWINTECEEKEVNTGVNSKTAH